MIYYLLTAIGLEPTTSSMSRKCSNQLSYAASCHFQNNQSLLSLHDVNVEVTQGCDGRSLPT